MNNSSKLILKLVLPWTNHIYIEYDLTMKWPPPVIPKPESLIDQELPEILPSQPTTKSKQGPLPPQPDDSLNIHYNVVVKG